jgi:hypothetical protein
MTTRAYQEPTSPWPIRLLGWLFRAIVVVLILLLTGAAVAAVGASLYYELTRTKTDDIDDMIDERLPAGATVERIYAVLDEEGIEHGTVQPFAGDDPQLLYDAVKAGTPIIQAIERNEGYSVELVDLEIVFVLNEAGTLDRALIYEERHQPEWLDENLDKIER